MNNVKKDKSIVVLVAGEPSGDAMAADLMVHLKKITNDSVSFVGVTGPLMRAQGCQSIAQIEDLSIMGIIEVIKSLPRILRVRKHIIQNIIRIKPALYIGVDFTDFNLSVAHQLKSHGIKTIQYKGPSAWAWRPNRIKKVKQACDLVLTIFPFEESFYKQHPDVKHTYVGYYLADQIPSFNKQDIRQQLKIPNDKQYVALMPGSRMQELKYLVDVFLETAVECHRINPNIHYMTSLINDTQYQWFLDRVKSIGKNLPIHIFKQQSHDILKACDAALLCSGTITLEALLYKKPMAVAYKYPKLYDYIIKPLIHVNYIALPNLLTNQALVPELLQEQVNVDNLSRAIMTMINDKNYQLKLQEQYEMVHALLKCNASDKTATIVWEMLNNMQS